MDNMSYDNIDNIQLDVLKEIGNIGAGNATTALSQLINKRVDMGIPKVKIPEFSELSDVLGGPENPIVGILLSVEGEINGMMMFALEQNSANNLINTLLEKEFNSFVEFTDYEFSALKEIGNIITSAYLSSLSTLTGLKIKPSVPYIAIDMAGAILSVPAIEFGKIGDKALLIQSDIGEGEETVFGYFILIPDLESYGKILDSLGV